MVYTAQSSISSSSAARHSPTATGVGSGDGQQALLDDAAQSVTRMQVQKRNGAKEPVDVNKIVRAVARSAVGLGHVEPLRVATRTISGLYDGATTQELDQLSIQTAASLIAEEPQYTFLAARLLSTFIDKEVATQEVYAFSQSIKVGASLGLIGDKVAHFVAVNSRKLNAAIDGSRSALFGYFGMRTVYDRYLLRHPQKRRVLETPQYFFMRVACGLAETPAEAVELYRLISSLSYLPSSPTLFNAGTQHTQLSSCYLLDSPKDDLDAIYCRYTDIARLSKYAGGIGLAYHRIRSHGSLIRSTNGQSQGIVPFLKTLDSSVAAVNQGGRRKGACCVYLESWHADIEQFLELRDNTGDDARRTHNLNLANWIPDLFMRRVQEDGKWSLFDPKEAPDLSDLWGPAFEAAYTQAETRGVFVRQVRARELYSRMMRTLAQTGNGWITFKDACNSRCNQTLEPGTAVHSSNLCTEIVEVTSAGETAVCNLGSINLAKFVKQGAVDYPALSACVATAIKYLDRVIDLNYYPTDEAAASNARWRPVGLGQMGLQDVAFLLDLPFDHPRFEQISCRIQEEIYLAAMDTSAELARKLGPHEAYAQTRVAQGQLQFDLWGVTPTQTERWRQVREKIAAHGLRNSLTIAIAPTATIASIAGVYECIEPQVSNLFKRETLSGDFMQINHYLVRKLKDAGLWTPEVRAQIKRANGSVQDIAAIDPEVRHIYRTAWELPQKRLIDMAASRGPYIDQSQSLNLFVETPTIGKLSSMFMYAWGGGGQKGLKTTYYMRSRPATRIAQATMGSEHSVAAAPSAAAEGAADATSSDVQAAVACSLENPESCESCQ